MADIGRATLVLDAIAESQESLTLTELATRTGLPRSTVHRIARSLENELFVVRGQGRPGYALGPGLLKFGMNAHLRLLSTNRPQMVRVARAVNENVELAVFSGREVVVVDQLASPERLRGVTKVGKSFSLHASCIGMALLAHLPAKQVDDLMSLPLRQFTANTVTDLEELERRLVDIRRTHIAVDVEEHDLGICAVGTGFIGPTGALQAVSVVMPTTRFAQKRAHAIEELQRINPAVHVSSIEDVAPY
ncbi:IclR family transcriptional regulator [Rhodococcoides fascians A25f]|uniref:IclR family transcriptional regulator n=1 Tax=Rhodococcoides fascians TaxID=1828 RepID=UPI00056159E2|nr:IclR family transcriptional regulator [Rhodococcus fascians]QII06163.1 IclR family transcriptional regulator [Rhodococcus fascians A25f]